MHHEDGGESCCWAGRNNVQFCASNLMQPFVRPIRNIGIASSAGPKTLEVASTSHGHCAQCDIPTHTLTVEQTNLSWA